MTKASLTTLALSLTVFATSAFADETECDNTMAEAASKAYAEQVGLDLSDPYGKLDIKNKVATLYYESLGSTEMPADNETASRVVVAARTKKTRTYKVNARQIGDTDECRVESVVETENNQDRDERIAVSLARSILDNLLYSEAESTWTAYVSYSTSKAKELDLKTLRSLLNTDEEIQIYSRGAGAVEALAIDEETGTRAELRFSKRTQRLFLRLAKRGELTDLVSFKVGKPDSGMLEVYVVGRTKTGRLVGLKATVVET